MKRKTAGIAALLLGSALLAGCTSWNASHNFNAPTPAHVIKGNWTRIETPGNFPSVVFECVGKDGVYQTMDTSSSVEVEPNDPNCAPGVQLGAGRP